MSIDFKQLLTDFPNALDTREKLRIALKASYPDEKLAIYNALLIYDSGAVDALKKLPAYDENAVTDISSSVVSSCGIDTAKAAELICSMAEAILPQPAAEEEDDFWDDADKAQPKEEDDFWDDADKAQPKEEDDFWDDADKAQPSGAADFRSAPSSGSAVHSSAQANTPKTDAVFSNASSAAKAETKAKPDSFVSVETSKKLLKIIGVIAVVTVILCAIGIPLSNRSSSSKSKDEESAETTASASSTAEPATANDSTVETLSPELCTPPAELANYDVPDELPEYEYFKTPHYSAYHDLAASAKLKSMKEEDHIGTKTGTGEYEYQGENQSLKFQYLDGLLCYATLYSDSNPYVMTFYNSDGSGSIWLVCEYYHYDGGTLNVSYQYEADGVRFSSAYVNDYSIDNYSILSFFDDDGKLKSYLGSAGSGDYSRYTYYFNASRKLEYIRDDDTNKFYNPQGYPKS